MVEACFGQHWTLPEPGGPTKRCCGARGADLHASFGVFLTFDVRKIHFIKWNAA